MLHPRGICEHDKTPQEDCTVCDAGVRQNRYRESRLRRWIEYGVLTALFDEIPESYVGLMGHNNPQAAFDTARRYILQLREKLKIVPQYYRVMELLRDTLREHGLCKPRHRRACTHCNALDELKKLMEEYKGQPIIMTHEGTSIGFEQMTPSLESPK